MWIICQADDSPEMSTYMEKKKKSVKMFSATVAIGTSRVNVAPRTNNLLWDFLQCHNAFTHSTPGKNYQQTTYQNTFLIFP